MTQPNLKQRIAAGDELNVAFAWFSMNDDELHRVLTKERFDLVFLDGQHSALNEEQIPVFCAKANALGIPVLFRIKHPQLAFLTGQYLDLGPLGIVVPQVEDPQTVRVAVESFYYPPVGKRGWGPSHAFGKAAIADRRAYADWWNSTGVLAVQLESVRAIQNAKSFVMPGVDLILFGPKDLEFSLESTKDAPFATLEDCYRFARQELATAPVRVSRGDYPWGRI